MTIAACYVCSEGVVFGADSTWTVPVESADGKSHERYFNHGQKVLQVGGDSTLGMVLWGLLVFGDTSCRTLVARFADHLQAQPVGSMEEAAYGCAKVFWHEYANAYKDVRQRVQDLQQKGDAKSDEEKDELKGLLDQYRGGFCLGGHFLSDRVPRAFEVSYNLAQADAGHPTPVPVGLLKTWGSPNLMNRILIGVDAGTLRAIQASEHWNGTFQDLVGLVAQHSSLAQPRNLPIREAIDWVDATLYTTIKVTKFTHLPPICGGPVDIAVITTDRLFRWVRRKNFSSAIHQQSPEF